MILVPNSCSIQKLSGVNSSSRDLFTPKADAKSLVLDLKAKLAFTDVDLAVLKQQAKETLLIPESLLG